MTDQIEEEEKFEQFRFVKLDSGGGWDPECIEGPVPCIRLGFCSAQHKDSLQGEAIYRYWHEVNGRTESMANCCLSNSQAYGLDARQNYKTPSFSCGTQCGGFKVLQRLYVNIQNIPYEAQANLVGWIPSCRAGVFFYFKDEQVPDSPKFLTWKFQILMGQIQSGLLPA